MNSMGVMLGILVGLPALGGIIFGIVKLIKYFRRPK